MHNFLELKNFDETRAYVFRSQTGLKPIKDIDFPNINELLFIDEKKEQIIKNFNNFLSKKPFNHILLIGAKGCGKSSLAKATIGLFQNLKTIEISKKNLSFLPYIIDCIREINAFFAIYIDDLSFEGVDDDFLGLKSTIDGGLELPPKNVIFIITSNYKNLIKQTRLEASSIGRDLNYNDINEQELSLKDRFGLILRFYNYTLDDYFSFVKFYFKNENVDEKKLLAKAFEFAQLKASRTPRTARQFYNEYLGEIK